MTASGVHDGGTAYRFSIAPMMQRTDRHFRYLARLISRRVRLYTEMVTSAAIVHGHRDHLLGYASAEHPVALQLGGSDPAELAAAAAIGADYGYDEINLNCGCPSDRVQAGAFGACLMREPVRVAACVAAMRAAVPATLPVTVKTRLGVDDLYDYDYFRDFVEQVAAAGCTVFQVHARKAWLAGLSPKENREIPPLEYDWVYRLKRARPDLTVVINGGITSSTQAARHVAQVDGVMIGRHAYAVPCDLAGFEACLYGTPAPLSRATIVAAYLDYAGRELARGVAQRLLLRHLFNLYQGQPGARHWRRSLARYLDEGAVELTRIAALAERMPSGAGVAGATAHTG
ncbi:MAG: tRNA dihydrouridine(20/20a) synthase DusA [Gammaproteobacteria bacterium]|nr:tRNA dihydrouridine(20/20a) synthase DusA [Gammaproteobacteria bacterium]MCP5202036.1 tRNA dihydrouridine(20/20a) synthase DusA [Gammaproteobacteria bacterium]